MSANEGRSDDVVAAAGWEALPPRSESHRGRRRRRERAEEEQKEEENSQQQPAWLRKNTPGLNSYLKVVLDQDTLSDLHQLTAQLRKDIENMVQERENDNVVMEKQNAKGNTDNGKEGQATPSKKKKRGPLRLKPRSLASLHMTFFFGGEVLCELPPEELEGWHKQLTKRFRQSGFVLDDDDHQRVLPTEVSVDDDPISNDFSFQLKEMAVFPPRRNNLIVAILEAAPAWHQLYRDVRNIALQQPLDGASSDDGGFESEGLREIAKRSAGKQTWTAHITLGNLFGGTKADTKALVPLCKDFSKRHLSTDNKNDDESASKLRVEKISMGGPVPKQVELNWDFEFRVQKR